MNVHELGLSLARDWNASYGNDCPVCAGTYSSIPQREALNYKVYDLKRESTFYEKLYINSLPASIVGELVIVFHELQKENNWCFLHATVAGLVYYIDCENYRPVLIVDHIFEPHIKTKEEGGKTIQYRDIFQTLDIGIVGCKNSEESYQTFNASVQTKARLLFIHDPISKYYYYRGRRYSISPSFTKLTIGHICFMWHDPKNLPAYFSTKAQENRTKCGICHGIGINNYTCLTCSFCRGDGFSPLYNCPNCGGRQCDCKCHEAGGLLVINSD